MKYLIKDLSQMTGISGARIRKWQERFGILNPRQGPNGYWYYDSEDYLVLRSINKRLLEGEKLANIIQLGSKKLLESPDAGKFSKEEWDLIKLIQKNSFHSLRKVFDEKINQGTMRSFIRHFLKQKIIMVGEAWVGGHISVAEEHSFTRFVYTYLSNHIAQKQTDEQPRWLVASFPGDVHEMGAFMHYCLLLDRGVPAKFCGALPEKYLFEEILTSSYSVVSLSMVLPQPQFRIDEIRTKLLSYPNIKKVMLGGYGYRQKYHEDVP